MEIDTKMKTFTKWFLLNSLMLTAVFFAEQKGLISLVIKNDLSHISILIMGLYMTVSGYVGKLCYLADRINENKEQEARGHLLKRSEIGWFAAEHFFSLGLLGTIIGLVISTEGSLDSSLPTSQIVAGLKEGLNTAFYTTVCGIVFSLPLQVQLLILKFKLEDK
ncbi:MAG: MotA/TolQ/ExbB proton channel family protein [Bacteroidetes bacterium]|nr:MotA/TolQ/ExbB proton channel family protein [Bacteroidota bacterium]